MEKLSYVQEYFMCVVNKKGNHIKERIRSKQENNKDTPVDKVLDHVEGVTKMLSALNWG